MRKRDGRTKRGLSDHRLYWRGDILWANVPGLDGRKARRSTGCRDEHAASARADEWERLAVDPTYAAATTTTLGGCLVKYLADHDRRRSSEAYKGKVRQKIGHFVRLWGNEMPLVRVTAGLVLEYIDARQGDGAKDITIKDEIGHLGQALKLARHLGTFHEPLDRILPPFFSAGHKPRGRWPTPAEMSAIVAELEPARAAHLVYILATGSRRGEAERAQRGDTDWARRLVRVRGTKTEASADDVPITSVNEPLLRWALERAPGGEGEPLFGAWGNLNRDLAAACKRAGIAKLSPNDLRRGFAKWHVAAGVSQNAVSKLLRHTTDKLAQTTYARVTGREVGDLVDAQIREVPIIGFLAQESVPPGATRCMQTRPPVTDQSVTVGRDPHLLPVVLPVYDETRETESNGVQCAHVSREKEAPPIRFERTTFALGKPSPGSGSAAENATHDRLSSVRNVLPVYADRFGLRLAAEAFVSSEWTS